jgi:outer membrane protein insertion porin family
LAAFYKIQIINKLYTKKLRKIKEIKDCFEQPNMRQLLYRFCAIVIAVVSFLLTAQAQVPDTIPPTSIDPKLIEWQRARVPKEYIIAGIDITGVRHLDTTIVLSISGLQVGDQFIHPGGDLFAKAIANLWRQKLFSAVDIYVTKIDGNNVTIEINVQERPRLGNFYFTGIKKSEQEDLQSKIGSLVKGTIISETMKKNIVEATTKFYAEK